MAGAGSNFLRRSKLIGGRHLKILGLLVMLFGVLHWGTAAAQAQSAWTLDPTSSTLSYQSVKKNTIVETNKIRNISGTLTPAGEAKISFDLNSVDTGIDLRNVRMRFLFFETFQYPTAEVTAKVDPAAFADLPAKRRMTLTLPFHLALHGISKDLGADVVVTMITDHSVSIASAAPVAVHAEDFGLLPNIEKLQQAANVSSIVPTASVSFDFVFNNDNAAAGAQASAAPASTAPAGTQPSSPPAAAQPVATSAATQPAATPQADVGPVATDAAKASFSDDECQNRFEVLSRTGAIYFPSASARLDPRSRPLIEEVIRVIAKCPNLKVEVAGHTDSDGSPATNMALSKRRAQAVADAIVGGGIPAAQITAAGYGEERPVVPNDSSKNKALNRRIEFSASTPAQ